VKRAQESSRGIAEDCPKKSGEESSLPQQQLDVFERERALMRGRKNHQEVPPSIHMLKKVF